MKVSREGHYCFWRELVPVFDRAGKECVVFVMSAAANVGTLPFLWFQVLELHTYFSSGYVISGHDKPGLLELSFVLSLIVCNYYTYYGLELVA